MAKSNWGIDPNHSEIAFKVKHLMITNVKGVFKEFEASIIITGGEFMTSDISFSLNAASVDTGTADRDTHLKSPDFFDVENHRKITFIGKEAKKVDDEGNYILTGDLTIKGITRPVKLDVEFGGVMKDPWGNEKAGYSITGKINRKDWDLNWNAALEAGGLLVSDEVKINCDIQLVKQA
ncbi:MAG: YceI family protein [Bacteroidetes bacterium]|nr:YceI family protein [Bacteroidota bacterium]